MNPIDIKELDRIAIYLSCFAVRFDRANPTGIEELERTHMICRIALAVPVFYALLSSRPLFGASLVAGGNLRVKVLPLPGSESIDS